jgi:hypothetical protein
MVVVPGLLKGSGRVNRILGPEEEVAMKMPMLSGLDPANA